MPTAVNPYWENLWETSDKETRLIYLREAFDHWGNKLLEVICQGPIPDDKLPALCAETDLFAWVFKRRRWLAALRWDDLETFIQKEFPEASQLPQEFSFLRIIKDAWVAKVQSSEALEEV